MRKILFRGKVEKLPNMPKVDWAYGDYLVLRNGTHYICDGTVWVGTLTPTKLPINPNTLGQYTGREDMNGTQIFEHDLIYIFNENTDEEDGAFEVKWSDDDSRFYAESKGLLYDLGDVPYWETKVVGNIFDNPELSEAGDEA